MGSVADLGRDFCHLCRAWHEGETCRAHRARRKREDDEKKARHERCSARMDRALAEAKAGRQPEAALRAWAEACRAFEEVDAQREALRARAVAEREALAVHSAADEDLALFVRETRFR